MYGISELKKWIDPSKLKEEDDEDDEETAEKLEMAIVLRENVVMTFTKRI